MLALRPEFVLFVFFRPEFTEHKVYVGNLPRPCNKAFLLAIFEKAGKISFCENHFAASYVVLVSTKSI